MSVTQASTATGRVGPMALAVVTLRDLGMPWAAIDAVLETEGPRLVRRYIQLHAERLEEHLAEQRGLLLTIEPTLSVR
jgi:DNA-binding transcriptional MerR regulator